MRVAVIGLGLLGGSVARRLARTHDVTGWDADAATRDLAAAAGLSVARDVEAAAAGADVAVVATPVAAIPAVLAALAGTDCPVLTDVGSVKSPVLAAARAAGVPDRFVGGHPMAGTEHTGFAAADPALLDGAAWVLCVEDDTDLAGWLRTAELVTGAGCHVVPCSARRHDDAQARISGLPHLLAAALAVAGADGGPLARTLAAGSFRDGTRVAGSRPELIAALCDGNAAALVRGPGRHGGPAGRGGRGAACRRQRPAAGQRRPRRPSCLVGAGAGGGRAPRRPFRRPPRRPAGAGRRRWRGVRRPSGRHTALPPSGAMIGCRGGAGRESPGRDVQRRCEP